MFQEPKFLKVLIAWLAALEVVVVLVVIAAFALPLSKAMSALALLLGLLISNFYFWRRLNGRDAQFGNLIVRAGEKFGDLDRLMISVHILVATVGMWLAVH